MAVMQATVMVEVTKV